MSLRKTGVVSAESCSFPRSVQDPCPWAAQYRRLGYLSRLSAAQSDALAGPLSLQVDNGSVMPRESDSLTTLTTARKSVPACFNTFSKFRMHCL
jgi:hypothetical protein